MPGSPNARPRLQLMVFDLDGTLVDSRKDLADSANALIDAYGGHPLPDEVIVGMVGEGANVLVQRALTAAGIDPAPADALATFLAIYDERLLSHTVPYPGIRKVLAHLASRARLAILTNKPSGATERVLEGLRLAQYFDGCVGGDGAFPRKPDPTGLLHLLAGAGATPQMAMLVGDSPIDLETARRAGTRVCIARWGFGYEWLDAAELRDDELVADTPEALMDAIDRLL